MAAHDTAHASSLAVGDEVEGDVTPNAPGRPSIAPPRAGPLTTSHPPAGRLSETRPWVGQKRGGWRPGLAALVKRWLEKDRADRVANATEVRRTLDEGTTASSSSAPTLSMSGPGSFGKAFSLYVVATVAVAIVAKAAVVAIGLPDWTFPGAVGLMLLGLPVLLLTGYAKSVARRSARATPTLTPGGTMVGRAPSGTLATIALRANPHLSWRRNLRYGMITMGSFVLLVIGYMVTRLSLIHISEPTRPY